MNRSLVILLLIMSITSCNNESKDRSNANSKATLKSADSTPPPNILGRWRYIEDGFVSMVIKKDSIFYPINGERGIYKLNGNNIMLYDDDMRGTFTYKMTGNDTLILADSLDRFVFIRANY